MSHRPERFSRQESNSRSNRNARDGRSEASSSRGENGWGRYRGGGRPPHLRGKEIGLYYRDRGKLRAKEKKEILIQLPPLLQDKIQSVLKNVKGFYESQYNTKVESSEENSGMESKYTHLHDSLFKRRFLRIISENIQTNLSKSINQKCKLERNEERDKNLRTALTRKTYQQEYESMTKTRIRLPAYQMQSQILDVIEKNQVVLVKGETGCGKTTQIPQFILDHELNNFNGSVTKIVCTQPRRISAISVAERVASERAEKLGDSVGFQIRLEKVPPRDSGSILFCTVGVLLQLMRGDPALKDFSHIILDEIHERSVESDFILALLKLIIPVRPDLKIILMSASLNAEQFSAYYNNCPIIDIPGFTFPVEQYYLEDVLQFTQFKFDEPEELPQNYKKHLKKYKVAQQQRSEFADMLGPHIRKLAAENKYSREVLRQLKNPNSENLSYDLIEELIRYICQTKDAGAILVFLPGIMDITKLHRLMQESTHYPESRYVIYPVHSRMPTIDQKLIFKEPPPGVRKIIIATSIAETSITIEDVVYVIDSGRMKLNNFDTEKNVQTLETQWVSLANAQQRRGRAGRVKSGVCYHLFSKARKMTLEQYPLPEMLRTRLEEVILQIKILQLGDAKSFLATVIDPPNSTAIDMSLYLLRTLNALDDEENLTPLGYHLAHLPLDPRTGKMIIWAALFSCVEPVFAIAASLSLKDAFYCPLGKEDEARKKKLELALGQYSDHIALAEALRRFETTYNRGGAGYFCREYFLSMNTLRQLSDLKLQFAQYLQDMKFLYSAHPGDPSANRNSHNLELVKAVVCAGLYPNIAVVRAAAKYGTRAWTPEDGAVQIHPSSVNDRMQNLPSPYLMYFMKQKSSKIFLHDTTSIAPPILLFAAPNVTIRKEGGEFMLNVANAHNFRCELRTAEIIQNLQNELNNMLEYKITHPGVVCWSGIEGELLNAIIELVCHNNEEMDYS